MYNVLNKRATVSTCARGLSQPAFPEPIQVNPYLALFCDDDVTPASTDVKYNVRSNDISYPLHSTWPLNRYYQQGELFSGFKNQPRLLVTCDWLTLRIEDTFKEHDFLGGIYHVNQFYRLELQDYGTQFFTKLAKCFYGNICFAEIQFEARPGANGLDGVALIKYDNWLFYDHDFMSVYPKEVFSHFFTAAHSRVLGITRCDIAIDGCDFDRFINQLVYSDSFEQLKVANVSPTQFNMKTRCFDGFNVGKRGNKKFCVYYDKTEEIKVKEGKKQYILDYFEKNGFDLSKGVKRFELRLNSEAFKDMGSIAGDMLEDCTPWACAVDPWQFNDDTFFTEGHLISIFEFQLRNFFEFVPGAAHSRDSRRSRRPKIQMFDFCQAEKKFVRVRRELLEGTRTAKIMVGRLLRDGYVTDNWDTTFSNFTTVRQTVMQYHLQEWITTRGPLIFDKIKKYAKVRGEEVAHFTSRDLWQDVLNNSLSFN